MENTPSHFWSNKSIWINNYSRTIKGIHTWISTKHFLCYWNKNKSWKWWQQQL